VDWVVVRHTNEVVVLTGAWHSHTELAATVEFGALLECRFLFEAFFCKASRSAGVAAVTGD